MKQIQDIITEIKQVIIDAEHPEKIVLFGSCARGEFGENSDIDIMVVKSTDQPRYKRALKILRNLRGLKYPVDITIYTPEEVKKWENVPLSLPWNAFHEGIVLYG